MSVCGSGPVRQDAGREGGSPGEYCRCCEHHMQLRGSRTTGVPVLCQGGCGWPPRLKGRSKLQRRQASSAVQLDSCVSSTGFLNYLSREW